MGTSGQSATSFPEFDPEAISDALDVLGDLFVWQLVPLRWQRVEQILDSLTEALATGDADTLRDATAELELAGPVRATRIGATPVVPAPESVRERVNHLVHSLGGTAPPPTTESGDSVERREGGGDRRPAG